MKGFCFKIGYSRGWGKGMWRGILAGLLVLSLLLFVIAPASAGLFYTGGIHIDSLSATMDITSEATVSVEYELVNHGDAEETVNLSVFPSEATARIDGAELSNPVDFEAGQVRKLTLLYTMELTSEEFQRIQFAPMLFFDDMANAQRIKSYSVQLVLPEGVNRLVSSSLPYDGSAIQKGRLTVTWNKEDIYPNALNVSWTTLDVDIAAVKKATPSTLTSAGEIVEVEIIVQNKGDNEVRGVTLSDSFFPGAFEAVAPLDDFELVEPEMSDPHLYWKKEVDSLKSGETKTYVYSVKVKTLSLETRLGALSILVNGIPVAVSNDIILYSELEALRPETPTREFPTKYVIIAAAIAGTVAGMLALRRRRRKTA